MKRDNLGDRMKKYEAVSQSHLMRRTPVIIRIDGKAFHTFTKGFNKPFDGLLIKTMKDTMKYLCQNIQGCVFGYTQSDEITLVLVDYKHLESSAWFDYNVQKCVSVVASMATMAFNQHFSKNLGALGASGNFDSTFKVYVEKCNAAMFDTRVFNLTKEEVCNCLIWRQQDAIKNSIQGLAQFLFAHKELQGLNSLQLKEKMLNEKDVVWDNIPIAHQRGVCCIKNENNEWVIDEKIPIFVQDRKYIEDLIYIGD